LEFGVTLQDWVD